MKNYSFLSNNQGITHGFTTWSCLAVPVVLAKLSPVSSLIEAFHIFFCLNKTKNHKPAVAMERRSVVMHKGQTGTEYCDKITLSKTSITKWNCNTTTAVHGSAKHEVGSD